MSSSMTAASVTNFGEGYQLRSEAFMFAGTATVRRSLGDGAADPPVRQEFEGGPGLELEKLKIGSPQKPACSSYGSRLDSPGVPSFSPATNPMECEPLWKDYPMVLKTVPSSYSYCSNPVSYYSATMYTPPYYHNNYKSSSVGTLFGGPKPVLSPPKLVGVGMAARSDIHGCCGSSPPLSLYGAYGGGTSQQWMQSGSSIDPSMAMYLNSPLSRSSSQSSGFISQKETHTPPPSARPTFPPMHDGSVANSCHFGHNDEDWIASSSHRRSLTAFPSAVRSDVPFRVTGETRGSTLRHLQDNNTITGSGNTCSRFARNDSSSSLNVRLTDSRRRSLEQYSDDDDDDDSGSFATARSSVTMRSVFKRKMETGKDNFVPEIQNLRARSKFNGSSGVRNLSTNIIEGKENEQNQCASTGLKTSVTSMLINFVRNVFLLVGILSMFLVISVVLNDTDIDWQQVNRQLVTNASSWMADLRDKSAAVWERYLSNSTFISETIYSAVECIPDVFTVDEGAITKN